MSEHMQPRRQSSCLEEGQLTAWHDDVLSPVEAARVLSHVASCARCAALDWSLQNDRRQVFALLSSIDPQPDVAPQPRAALAHFRERLAAQNAEHHLPPAGADQRSGNVTLPALAVERHGLRPLAPPVTTPRRPRRVWFQALVAALVFAMLLGTVLLLLRPWWPSTGQHLTQTGQHDARDLASCIYSTDTNSHLCTMIDAVGVGRPVMLSSEAGGLKITMWITPGPYFLDEMLVADLALTNYSEATYLLQGIPSAGNPSNVPEIACHPPFAVQATGGGGPSDPALGKALSYLANCWDGPGSNGTVQVQPGRTINFHQVIALTNSGNVTLTAQGVFQKAVLETNGVTVVNATGPLDGHWPALHISVASQVPPARAISLRREGLDVHVVAPPALDDQLLYWPTTSCGRTGGGSSQASWGFLPSETVTPDCGGQVTATPELLNSWVFVVGAPGYAFALEKYPS